ncbi:hypothetical protein, partial [Lentzea sp.]|uniref:hypothetical protein n=1 Tax=Lentzea sp. TaxID=56099 RepID=UPI002ED36636
VLDENGESGPGWQFGPTWPDTAYITLLRRDTVGGHYLGTVPLHSGLNSSESATGEFGFSGPESDPTGSGWNTDQTVTPFPSGNTWLHQLPPSNPAPTGWPQSVPQLMQELIDKVVHWRPAPTGEGVDNLREHIERNDLMKSAFPLDINNYGTFAHSRTQDVLHAWAKGFREEIDPTSAKTYTWKRVAELSGGLLDGKTVQYLWQEDRPAVPELSEELAGELIDWRPSITGEGPLSLREHITQDDRLRMALPFDTEPSGRFVHQQTRAMVNAWAKGLRGELDRETGKPYTKRRVVALSGQLIASRGLRRLWRDDRSPERELSAVPAINKRSAGADAPHIAMDVDEPATSGSAGKRAGGAENVDGDHGPYGDPMVLDPAHALPIGLDEFGADEGLGLSGLNLSGMDIDQILPDVDANGAVPTTADDAVEQRARPDTGPFESYSGDMDVDPVDMAEPDLPSTVWDTAMAEASILTARPGQSLSGVDPHDFDEIDWAAIPHDLAEILVPEPHSDESAEARHHRLVSGQPVAQGDFGEQRTLTFSNHEHAQLLKAAKQLTRMMALGHREFDFLVSLHGPDGLSSRHDQMARAVGRQLVEEADLILRADEFAGGSTLGLTLHVQLDIRDGSPEEDRGRWELRQQSTLPEPAFSATPPALTPASEPPRSSAPPAAVVSDPAVRLLLASASVAHGEFSPRHAAMLSRDELARLERAALHIADLVRQGHAEFDALIQLSGPPHGHEQVSRAVALEFATAINTVLAGDGYPAGTISRIAVKLRQGIAEPTGPADDERWELRVIPAEWNNPQ